MKNSAATRETFSEEQRRLMNEAQVRGGTLCGPERGWITRNDGSRYNRTGWYLAHVWLARGGRGWSARVDTMIAQYNPERTLTAETYVIQADGGFGETRDFATADEAQAHCDLVLQIGGAS
jgi:hypothetical protein